MIRYPLPVSEWCRTIWASEAARSLWQPRIQAVSQAWHAAERASVGAFRHACLQTISPEGLPELSAKAAESRLELIILARQGDSGSYSASTRGVTPGEPWTYRVALVERRFAAEFSAAFRGGDDTTVGRLLGFPECCRSFFDRVWVQGGWRDTTWPMFDASEDEGAHESNILLRWIGVRYVPHLPCRFDCEATAELGGKFRRLLPAQERSWSDELLSMPIEWSALHGIGEIKTPLFTVSTKTDGTAEPLVVRRKGSGYPELGARGLRFPYHRNPDSLRVDETLWTDNGFTSREAMEDAHARLLELLPDRYGTVIDLGCGNGRLLSYIDAERRVGVEADAERAARAQLRLDRVEVGDCSDPELGARLFAEEHPDVVIAQACRNPPDVMPDGLRVLTYSYETGDARWR